MPGRDERSQPDEKRMVSTSMTTHSDLRSASTCREKQFARARRRRLKTHRRRHVKMHRMFVATVGAVIASVGILAAQTKTTNPRLRHRRRLRARPDVCRLPRPRLVGEYLPADQRRGKGPQGQAEHLYFKVVPASEKVNLEERVTQQVEVTGTFSDSTPPVDRVGIGIGREAADLQRDQGDVQGRLLRIAFSVRPFHVASARPAAPQGAAVFLSAAGRPSAVGARGHAKFRPERVIEIRDVAKAAVERDVEHAARLLLRDATRLRAGACAARTGAA